MHRYVFGIIIMLFLGMSNIAFGQSFSTEPNITITANPADPEPGEDVYFTVDSYEVNLDLAYIIWQSGNIKKEGYGEKEFVLKTSLDEKSGTSVLAEITLTNGTKLTREMTVSVKSYDLIWEALDAKYPPFYLGKKIPVRENNIRVSVLDSGNSNIKQNAFYWSRNGNAIQNGSGAGKNFIDIKNTELEKSENIGVSIVSSNNQAARSINIPFSINKVLFYEYTPLSGVMTNKIITNRALGYDNTTSIFALPLGINKNSRIKSTWNLSRNTVTNQQNPYLLSFRVPNESGIVPLSINIENLGSIYQEFIGSLNLNY